MWILEKKDNTKYNVLLTLKVMKTDMPNYYINNILL